MGLGTHLMQRVIQDLLAYDIDTIHLWPTKGRVGFYERLGFRALSGEQPVMKLDRDLVNNTLQGMYKDTMRPS